MNLQIYIPMKYLIANWNFLDLAAENLLGTRFYV